MKYQRNIIPLIILLLFISGCSKDETAKKEIVRPVKAVQVGGLEVLTGRTFPGKAKATQEANLSFRVRT
jgi:PBP1b-binding outer membrane lipoprotein LpoB